VRPVLTVTLLTLNVTLTADNIYEHCAVVSGLSGHFDGYLISFYFTIIRYVTCHSADVRTVYFVLGVNSPYPF